MNKINNINSYQNVLDQFKNNRNYHTQYSRSRVPHYISDIPLGGILNTNAAVLVLDIAKSKETINVLGLEDYADWLGCLLHLIFNCIDDYDGFVDKYTGDGVMASFSKSTLEDQCNNAVMCALKISQIIQKVINPYFKEKNFPKVKLRIGIDYGKIYVENIGKRGKSQLILIGNAANAAKIFESEGKKLNFNQNSTIVIGYDVKINLKENLSQNKKTKLIQFSGHIDGNSEITAAKPYNFYEYTGRYIEE